MLKQYNVRLSQQDIKQLDKMEGCRSEHIRKAIGLYLQPDTSNVYNVDLFNLLKDQLQDLRNDKRILQDRVDYLMLPWYKKAFLPMHK